MHINFSEYLSMMVIFVEAPCDMVQLRNRGHRIYFITTCFMSKEGRCVYSLVCYRNNEGIACWEWDKIL